MAVILEEQHCIPTSHNENSKDMREEQEQWFKEKMAKPTWARPFKPCSEVVIELERIDRERS